MKQEVSTPIMIGLIAAIALIIGIVAWQVFGRAQANGGTADQLTAAKARKAKREGD